MLTQGESEKLTLMSERAFADLENRIMSDVVIRLKDAGASYATTDWELSRLAQFGISERNITEWIAETMHVSEEEAAHVLSDTTYQEYNKQKRAYQIEGLSQVPFKDNMALQSQIEAITAQTKGTFQNITGSLGFAYKTPAGRMQYQSLREFYTTTLDNAMMDIQTGAFSYNTVLERTINKMTSSGLRTIDYESGWSNRVEVAARRAIMTGFGQVQRFMSEQIADELGTEYFEVSAHGGARPEHAEWQGGVYTKEELETICGLGDPLGLCGINCYHSYDPFIPGVSVRRYSEDQLAELKRTDAEEHDWNGKSYNKYEALQEQRHMERVMRKYRQDIDLLEIGGADKETITNKRIKYQTKYSQYKAFSKRMKLPMQRDRIYNDGLQVKPDPIKVANLHKNDIIKEIKEIGIKGEISLKPFVNVDVTNLSFDDQHINFERQHQVSVEEAQNYISDAKVYIKRWNGQFIKYYSQDGAAFVNMKENNIRTAFKSAEFTNDIKQMMGVLKKWKIIE